jgi:AcrR family transcriptional regulator
MTSLSSPAGLTSKGRATRDRIVDAASRLMLVDGVSRTTLDDVGAEARVGRSQLYHYFDGKSDLVDAVIGRHARDVLGDQEPFLSSLDSWEAWQQWRDVMVAGQRAHHCIGGCPLGSLASELSDVDERSRLALERVFDEWEARLREGVESMLAAGLLARGTDTASLATAVLAAVQGGLLLTQLRHRTDPLEAALDGAIAMLRAAAPAR